VWIERTPPMRRSTTVVKSPVQHVHGEQAETAAPSDTSAGAVAPSLIIILWRAVSIVLFDVPMTEVLSLNKALAACHVPHPLTLEHWIMPALKGRCWTDHVVVLGLIFAPVPLLPEMCLGLALAFIAYLKVAMVLTVIGFPFCFGLLLLVWAHTWCFIWWPFFFSYYIVRGVMYGVPCRFNLICEGLHLCMRAYPGKHASVSGVREPVKRSPEMASISTQAAWVAASAASAAGVDAGWRWVRKDIASPNSFPQAALMTSSSNISERKDADGAMPTMSMLPRAQVDEDRQVGSDPLSQGSTSASAG